MQISNKSVQRISQIYSEHNNIEKRPAKKTMNTKDKVSLSSEGKEMQAILHKAYTPQGLSDRAKTIQKEVSSGTYHVKGEDIAASIIKYFNQRV